MNGLLIGIGNPWRGDDAAGVAVIRKLRERGAPGAMLAEHSGEGASLMELWAGAETVILVDAVRSGAEPGAIHRFEIPPDSIPARVFAASTHAFGPAQAIELARLLGRLPRRLIVYGIEGESFEAGTAPSPRVAMAVEGLAERLARELA